MAEIRGAAGLPRSLKAGNLRQEADPGAIQSLLAHGSVGTQKFYVKWRQADAAREAREARERTRKSHEPNWNIAQFFRIRSERNSEKWWAQ